MSRRTVEGENVLVNALLVGVMIHKHQPENYAQNNYDASQVITPGKKKKKMTNKPERKAVSSISNIKLSMDVEKALITKKIILSTTQRILKIMCKTIMKLPRQLHQK